MGSPRAVGEWISAVAHPLTARTPDEPLDDLAPLGAIVGDAAVVGLGESTRASHEVTVLAHRVLRLLVVENGFRVLALQDDAEAVAGLDAYVRGAPGDLRALMADLWTPWQSAEMADLVTWLRAHNEARPDDPVGLVGLTPPAAKPRHYDEVLAHVRRVAPDRLDALRERYDTIRSAQRIGEHVLRARGTHPGRPFVDQAREALELVRAMPTGDGHAHTVVLAELIERFHATSVAAGYDFDAGSAAAADAIMQARHATGAKIVYWEGMAHTANAAEVGLNAMGTTLRSVGARLRERMGERYKSLVIGFDHGRIHDADVPRPSADFADAVFGAAGIDAYLLDLRSPQDAEVGAWLRGPHKMRIIAGIYDPAHDSEHFVAAGALDEWFDVVLRVGQITPTTLLAGS